MRNYEVTLGHRKTGETRKVYVQAKSVRGAAKAAIPYQFAEETVLDAREVPKSRVPPPGSTLPPGYTFIPMTPPGPDSEELDTAMEIRLYESSLGEVPADEDDLDGGEVIPEMWDELSALLRGLA